MKTLAIVTGTRAEYGLLRPVIRRVLEDDRLQLQLLVTGAHLRAEYGGTVSEIEQDGFPIAARIDILRYGNTREGVLQSTSLAMSEFGAWFSLHRPDGCLVLGDRYEIFAAAAAAAMLCIPVIHVSGGDVTNGAQDDWFRHCITKMASLHFPYCDAYAARLIRMGEEPARVHNVGGLGSENIRSLPLLGAEELSRALEFDFTRPYCLVTYHPETLSEASPAARFAELLGVMEQYPDMGWCITKANADAGGASINAMIDAFVKFHPNARAFTSMGVLRYLSAMRGCRAVVGNSSSGVVETPDFGVPCVNIGLRQAGRLMCANVLCCGASGSEIAAALKEALTPEFYAAAHSVKSPFAKEDTSGEIVRITAEFLYSELAQTPKKFYDGETI